MWRIKKSTLCAICFIIPSLIDILQYATGGTVSVILWLSVGFCAVMTVFDTVLGITSYTILSMMSALNDEIAKYLIVALLCGVAVNYFLTQNIRKLYLKECWLPIVLLLFIIFTRICDRAPQTSVYQLFYIEMLLVIIISNRISDNEKKQEACRIFTYTYIVCAVLFSIFSLLDMENGASRLRAFGTDTVRSLANMLGIAIIFCMFGLSKLRAAKIKVLYVMLISYFSIILLMTGSRGIMYAVIIVALYYIVAEKLISLRLLVPTALIVIAAVILAGYFIPSSMNLGRIYEADDGSRIVIWTRLLENMTWKDYLVGMGLNNSYRLTHWYSHSVFVDALVSIGIPAVAALIIWCLSVWGEALKNKNHMKAAWIMAIVLFFIPHGSVFTDTFWVMVWISYYIPDKPGISLDSNENAANM